ncbi:hypothetical protein ACIPPJ_30100 [Streptomyces sp. NPDC086091]|uniref:hypothetical protein n=1 Tax=Streptomyces sp. NPDC086091 TaxID=3365751 RepID=UPI003824ADB0
MGFDADTGRLDAVPDAPAYGTQLRWIAPKLITAANEKVPDANVRALHVLAPVSMKADQAAADPALRPAAAVAPVAPDAASQVPPRDRGAPPGRAAVPSGPGHRGSGGAADRSDV